MATLTEMVAAVVVQSSAAAFSHFGVTLEAEKIERPQPAAERVIARSPRKASTVVTPAPKLAPARLAECPEDRQMPAVRPAVARA